MVVAPGAQVLLALAILGVIAWFGYTTGVLLDDGRRRAEDQFARERAKYERWLNEARAQTEAAQAMLEQRGRQFAQVGQHLDVRHEILRSLLEYSAGTSSLDAADRDEAPVWRGDEEQRLFVPAASRASQARDIGIEDLIPGPASAEASTLPASPSFASSLNDAILWDQVRQAAERVTCCRAPLAIRR